jgi:hypothetical protein
MAVALLGRAFARLAFLTLLVLVALTGCRTEPPKKLPSKAHTTTELRAVRRGVSITHAGETTRAPYARERLGEGAEVTIAEGGLAWVRRDGGATPSSAVRRSSPSEQARSACRRAAPSPRRRPG